MKIFDIKGTVIYENVNINSMKELVEEAVKKGVDLSGADFKGVDLSYADLRFAKLCGADLRFASLFGTHLVSTML